MKTLTMLVAMFFGMFLSVSANADTYLPLAKKGEIPNPAVLADRIEESLKQDASGGGSIRGANVTPNQYLLAVQTAGGTVDTVGELPTYLRNLLVTPMPTGDLRLSQVIQRSDGTRELDLSIGREREAFDGEEGWYDANTGKLILAGSCTNTPIVLTIPILGSNKPVEVDRRVPFPSQANACPLGPTEGAVYLKPIVRAPDAANHKCAKEHMLPTNGLLKTGGPTTWVEGAAFSRTCGPLLTEYPLGTKRHAVRAVLQDAESGKDAIIFQGWLTGDKLEAAAGSERALSSNGEAIYIDLIHRKGHVVFTFDNQSEVQTPTASGIGEDLARFREGCRAMVSTAIEN